MDILVVGHDSWLRMDGVGTVNKALGVNPKKWMHVDATKLKDPAALKIDTAAGAGDLLEVAGLLTGVTDAQRVDDRHFNGTIDLTLSTGGSKPAQDLLDNAGDKAKSIPFTVALDRQG